MAKNNLITLDGIINPNKIEKANAELVAGLSQGKLANEKVLYRGIERQVWYFENNKFWWGNFSEIDYYWNVFGLGEIESLAKFNEVCNVNYFKGGKESNHAGLFAKDNKGNTYLVHDGKFRNGLLPVKENEFISNIVDVRINGELYKYFLVANLSSNSLHKDISLFITGVANFKGVGQ